MFVSLNEKVSVEFKKHLMQEVEGKKITEDTANTYLSSARVMMKHFDNLGIRDTRQISEDDFENYFDSIKTKNNFSKAKNALERLKMIYPYLTMPSKEFFKSRVKYKRKRGEGGGSGLPPETIKRKINGIRNKKLKLGYRLALATGLRVSEVAKLRKEDIKRVKGSDSLIVYVREGKGRKDRKVIGLEDSYLLKGIRELLQEQGEGNLFYSRGYMMGEAYRLGFECHDLRRIFAKEYLKQRKEQGDKGRKAVKEVAKQLGHKKLKTTSIYLKY